MGKVRRKKRNGKIIQLYLTSKGYLKKKKDTNNGIVVTHVLNPSI